MYKVMLLDDEPWELKGLKNMLPWNEHGFEVVCELINPLEALARLKEDRTFDVLVSDIRMPGLDGISLMKELRAFLPNLEIIFVSGYAEFEYAREALRSGAYDYLLKPIDLDLSDSLLSGLKDRLDEKRRSRLLLLEDSLEGGKPGFLEVFPEMNAALTCCVVIGGSFLTDCFEYIDAAMSFCIPRGPGCIVCLLAYDESFDPGAYLQSRFPQEMLGLSLPVPGSEAIKPNSLNRLITQAFTAFHSSFFLTPSSLCVYYETDQNTLRNIADHIHLLFSGKESEAIQLYLEELPEKLKEKTVNVAGIVRLWNQLMLLCLADSYEESCLLSVEHLLESFSDIRQLCQRLFRILQNQPQAKAERLGDDGREIYGSMIQYVNEHFREPISLQDIADHAHISFTYASKLFKKYTDMNYSKYLTRLRMELACELLSSTQETTEKICYMIGYNDYFYFNKTFKKYTGQTPLQYRQK